MERKNNSSYTSLSYYGGGISSEKIKNAKTVYLLKVETKIKHIFKKAIEINILSKETVNTICHVDSCMLIVGNSVPKAELDEFSLTEFENYLYEIYFGKKIAIVYGNCHTTVISEVLNQCSEFNKVYRIYPIKLIHTITDVTYFENPVFKWCDLFVHQSIQKQNRYGEAFSSENIMMLLSPHCRIIAIPNVYRLPVCFFPQYTKEPEFVKRDGGSVFFRDSVLDEAAERGLSYKDTVADYRGREHFEKAYLDDLLWTFFAKVEKREKDWDIKCLEYIREHYKTEKLFYDPNHPTNILLFYIAMQLLKYLGIKTEKNSLKDYKLTPLTGYEMPLLPEVKSHFGMVFLDGSEMREQSFNKVRMGVMNGYEDYIKQYLACEWQNEKVGGLYALKWHCIYYLMKIYNQIWKLFCWIRVRTLKLNIMI